MMLCSAFTTQLQSWLRDYDRIQSFAVILIYVQIGCALVGSLGALYNGVLLINLGIALFALVAIESSSQSLARTYAVLLFCAIFLDISWFILFTHEIWNISSGIYGTFVIFSVKLTLSMEIIGFLVRLSSSLLWIQMYRLGVSYLDSSAPREADADLRNRFLNPATPAIVRHPSGSDEVLGGSIYDLAYYSSLFEDGKVDGFSYGSHNHEIGVGVSTETSQLKLPRGRSLQVNMMRVQQGHHRAFELDYFICEFFWLPIYSSFFGWRTMSLLNSAGFVYGSELCTVYPLIVFFTGLDLQIHSAMFRL